jgi:hypothetical protein
MTPKNVCHCEERSDDAISMSGYENTVADR